MRIVRYADDFVIMIHGTRSHPEALWYAGLSVEKTRNPPQLTKGSTSWVGVASLFVFDVCHHFPRGDISAVARVCGSPVSISFLYAANCCRARYLDF